MYFSVYINVQILSEFFFFVYQIAIQNENTSRGHCCNDYVSLMVVGRNLERYIARSKNTDTVLETVKSLYNDHLWDCPKVVLKTTFGQSQRWSLIRDTLGVENEGKTNLNFANKASSA